MAEIKEDRDLQNDRHILRRKSLAVAVATGANTTLLELIVEGISKLSVHFDVSDANLDAFAISGRVHPDAAYHTIASASGDYTSPAGRMLRASADLTGIAAAGSGWFDMDVSALQAVKIAASAAGSAAAVDIYANGE